MITLAKRNLLRYNLLVQLYEDFFCYGYERCIETNYTISRSERIEIIAALYYLYHKKWIFFKIEKDSTISAYILGLGIEEIERFISESGNSIFENLPKKLLQPVFKEKK